MPVYSNEMEYYQGIKQTPLQTFSLRALSNDTKINCLDLDLRACNIIFGIWTYMYIYICIVFLEEYMFFYPYIIITSCNALRIYSNVYVVPLVRAPCVCAYTFTL